MRSPRSQQAPATGAGPTSNNFEQTFETKRRPQTARARFGQPATYMQTAGLNDTSRRSELERQRQDLATAQQRVEDELQKMSPRAPPGGGAAGGSSAAARRPQSARQMMTASQAIGRSLGISGAGIPVPGRRPLTATRRTFGGLSER